MLHQYHYAAPVSVSSEPGLRALPWTVPSETRIQEDKCILLLLGRRLHWELKFEKSHSKKLLNSY